MTRDLVLVFDAGGGGGRAVIYDAHGERLAGAVRPWQAFAPPTLAPFGREYDPAVLRVAFEASVREAVQQVEASRIGAIACTGQRIACVWVDEGGEVLYAGPNGDVRALTEPNLDGLDDDEAYARTGRFPPFLFAPGRLRWFASSAPEVFGRIRHVLGLPNWFAFELTGIAGVDATIAADLMMLDVPGRTRAPTRCGGLPDEVWPALSAPWDTLGELRADAGHRVGLPPGIPVAVGCADTAAALPFSGADTLVAGSSAPMLRRVDAPLRDPKGRLWLDPHVHPGDWCLEANLGEMGAAHRWLANLIGATPFDAFDALASEAPLGCRGASSHLGPRAMDLRALNTGRPAALLMPFGETTLTEAAGRAELARAHIESCAFAARAGRAWLDALAPRADAMHLLGGSARSPFFADVLASVLESPVFRGPEDATRRGAAACALVASGAAASWDDAVAVCSREPTRHEPSDDYEDAYERWLEREEGLEEM